MPKRAKRTKPTRRWPAGGHEWSQSGWTEIAKRALANARTNAKERRKRGRAGAGRVDVTLRYLVDLLEEHAYDCALSHRPLGLKPGPDLASLDRIDNTKGYVRGNLRWVRACVNVARAELSDAEFIGLCRDVYVASLEVVRV